MNPIFIKVRSLPESIAAETHRQLTVGINTESLAYWRDGTIKGRIIDCFVKAYQENDPVLVQCPGRADYEVWIKKTEEA
jgi:hypothetical protein